MGGQIQVSLYPHASYFIEESGFQGYITIKTEIINIFDFECYYNGLILPL